MSGGERERLRAALGNLDRYATGPAHRAELLRGIWKQYATEVEVIVRAALSAGSASGPSDGPAETTAGAMEALGRAERIGALLAADPEAFDWITAEGYAQGRASVEATPPLDARWIASGPVLDHGSVHAHEAVAVVIDGPVGAGCFLCQEERATETSIAEFVARFHPSAARGQQS